MQLRMNVLAVGLLLVACSVPVVMHADPASGQSQSQATALDSRKSPVDLVDYPSSPTWGKLPELDRKMLLQFADISRVFSRPGAAAGIWDEGFRPDKTPKVVGPRPEGTDENPRYAYVIGHPDPGKLGDASKVDLPAELGLPDVYRITKGPGLDAFQPGVAFIPMKLGGVDGWVMAYGKGKDPDGAVPAEYWVGASMAVHELFHVYEAKFGYENERVSLSGFPADNAAWSAMALLEDRVLQQQATTPEQARQILRTFQAIRRAREAMSVPDPAKVQANEQGQLLYEGMARYVEWLHVRAAGRTPPTSQLELDTPLKLYQEVALPMPGRAYVDGHRLGELLDVVYDGHSWRSKLYTKDVNLEKLVRDAVTPPTAAEGEQLITQAKQDHDYQGLLRQVEKANFPKIKKGIMELLPGL